MLVIDRTEKSTAVKLQTSYAFHQNISYFNRSTYFTEKQNKL